MFKNLSAKQKITFVSVGGIVLLRSRDRPGRRRRLPVAVALLFAATIVAIAGHLIPSYLPVAAVRVLAFGLAITFAGRAVGDFRLVGLFKRVRDTGFARLDTWVYAPLCLGLGVAIFYVAYNAT